MFVALLMLVVHVCRDWPRRRESDSKKMAEYISRDIKFVKGDPSALAKLAPELADVTPQEAGLLLVTAHHNMLLPGDLPKINTALEIPTPTGEMPYCPYCENSAWMHAVADCPVRKQQLKESVPLRDLAVLQQQYEMAMQMAEFAKRLDEAIAEREALKDKCDGLQQELDEINETRRMVATSYWTDGVYKYAHETYTIDRISRMLDESEPGNRRMVATHRDVKF